EELEVRLMLDASSEQFISRLYDDLFQRPADMPGLEGWSALIDRGVDRDVVASGMLQSPEFHMQELGSLYFSLLGRSPDPQGFNGFFHFLQTGGRLDQVETVILGSPEYFQRAGGGQDTFLVSLYHDVLGRDIDPVGRDGFTRLLQDGTTPTEVAAVVLN